MMKMMNTMRYTRLRPAVCATLTVFLLQAQQQPPQPGTNADAGVTFKSQTQLVVETVTLRDKNGKAIEGLTAKDFTITEDGVVQAIQFCDFQKLPDAPAPQFSKRPNSADAAPAQDNAAPKPKVASATKTQIAPEAPGDIRFANRRLLALYFDMSAMPVPDQLRSFAAALKFIKTQMTASDLVLDHEVRQRRCEGS